MAKKKEGRVFGKCECGGVVRGIKDFDRWWTWCEKCTPVQTISYPVSSPSGGENG